MTNLKLSNVGYNYGQGGVSDISFEANGGKIVAIVGASGSGKSTILKLIAGFLQPHSGKISIDDQIIATPKMSVAPKERSIGLVFQNHALLPHMNVFKNIEFGCKQGIEDRYAQINRIMRELRIEQLAKKFPHEISGGESQRVSLARAVAADAHIFLMDEPFSSIDSVFRRDLRNDMLRFLRQKSRVTIIVTHDAEEALELADQVVVIDKGRILQMGEPQEIYFHPQHMQVAQLFGEINHVQGRHLVKALTGEDAEESFIRPEAIKLNSDQGVEGRILHVAYRGSYSMISVIIEGERCLKVRCTLREIQAGGRVRIDARP